jgi:hypothetical protein
MISVNKKCDDSHLCKLEVFGYKLNLRGKSSLKEIILRNQLECCYRIVNISREELHI